MGAPDPVGVAVGDDAILTSMGLLRLQAAFQIAGGMAAHPRAFQGHAPDDEIARRALSIADRIIARHLRGRA